MSRAAHVLDASALLCLLFDEPGADRVEGVLHDALVSAANHAEVVGKLIDRGLSADEAIADLRELALDVIPLDRDQAEVIGSLRTATRVAGLSLGDRACLALASLNDAVAITTDRSWGSLDIGVKIEVVR